MFDSRRYLGTFAVFTLVVLRLTIGWHFFREGMQKIEYDPHDRQLRMTFTAEGFMNQAKGPLSEWYHSQSPNGHNWQQLLATPQQNVRATEDEVAARAKWAADYKRRRDEAKKSGAVAPFEFPPSATYHDWATRIADDWRAMCDKVKLVSGLTDEQKRRAEAALESRLQQLTDYLSSEAEAITEYRHELWRLNNLRTSPEAAAVPFVDERIATKIAETSSKPSAWTREAKAIETAYRDDLRNILAAEQRDQRQVAAELDDALTDGQQARLRIVNVIVTALTISVGVCLLLGLFTRTAAIFGALFLFGVIASQPPWLGDTLPTMPQTIELAGLLVLAGTGAGRWLGLDFFTYGLVNRWKSEKDE